MKPKSNKEMQEIILMKTRKLNKIKIHPKNIYIEELIGSQIWNQNMDNQLDN